MIKFQLKLRAGNDYSHQSGFKKIPSGLRRQWGWLYYWATCQSEKTDDGLMSWRDRANQPSAILLTNKSGEVDWKEAKPSKEREWSRCNFQGHHANIQAKTRNFCKTVSVSIWFGVRETEVWVLPAQFLIYASFHFLSEPLSVFLDALLWGEAQNTTGT